MFAGRTARVEIGESIADGIENRLSAQIKLFSAGHETLDKFSSACFSFHHGSWCRLNRFK
jgi:hypothetical protein